MAARDPSIVEDAVGTVNLPVSRKDGRGKRRGNRYTDGSVGDPNQPKDWLIEKMNIVGDDVRRLSLVSGRRGARLGQRKSESRHLVSYGSWGTSPCRWAGLRLRSTAAAVILGFFHVCAAWSDDTVLRIGTNYVSSSALRASIARSGMAVTDPAAVERAVLDLVNQEVLVAEARRLGYDRDPEVVELTQRLMVQKLVADQVDRAVDRTPPTEAELRSYHDRHAAEFETPAMVRGQVVTLLIKGNPDDTKKTGQEALEFAKERPFTEVVKRFSDLSNERINGGDTGWLAAGSVGKRYPPEVLAALLALESPGQVGPLVMTDKAAFLVQLSDRRPARVTSFDEAKPGLQEAVQRERRQRAYDAYCAKIKEGAGVTVNAAAVKRVAAEIGTSATPPPAPFRTP